MELSPHNITLYVQTLLLRFVVELLGGATSPLSFAVFHVSSPFLLLHLQATTFHFFSQCKSIPFCLPFISSFPPLFMPFSFPAAKRPLMPMSVSHPQQGPDPERRCILRLQPKRPPLNADNGFSAMSNSIYLVF